jgi:hypothetical protein
MRASIRPGGANGDRQPAHDEALMSRRNGR